MDGSPGPAANEAGPEASDGGSGGGAGAEGGSPPAAAAEKLARQESSGEAALASSQQAHDGCTLAADPGSSGRDGEQQEPAPMPLDAAVEQQEQQQEQHGAGELEQRLPPEAGIQPQAGDEHAAQEQQQQQQQQEEEEEEPGQQQGFAQSPPAADGGGGDQLAPAGALAGPDPDHQHQQPGPGPEPEMDEGAAEAAAEAAAAAALEQQRKLNELEAVLRQGDAVMEPAIMERLREYVMANGHPQAAVEYLTESYVGYAQMASLVCRWLEMTEQSGGGGGGGTSGGGPGAANGGTAAAAAAASPGSWAAARGGHGGGSGAAGGSAGAAAGGGGPLDEAFYLRQLAKERFDPHLFATVFTSGGSGAPQWLNGLIASPGTPLLCFLRLQRRACSHGCGRSLVYELAGRYKNSLLLNFAIHKILMQPGREKEVAAVGGSLAGYFGVFHRLMAAKLREAAAAGDDEGLAALTRSLKEDCCASQHTYVHAQQVLCELARHPHGARFRRIAQELEEHAAALHGPVVWKMRQWFAEPGQPEAHYQVAALLSDILAASVSGVPPASEMGKLYRMYWPQEPGQQPPPVSFLRHPRVFDVLLHGLFSPGRQLQPEVVQAYSGLLALAAAADDRRPCGPADGSGGAQPPDDLLDVSGVAATRAALEAAAELAQHVLQDQKSSAEELERAAAVMEYPCCAAGLLRAMSAQLTRPDYWQTAYHLLKSPPFLSLLSLLVPRQPALHGSLLQLVGRALGALGNTNHDMAKGFLSIALVSAGRVFEVLRWAEEWKQSADPSLVRHLVFGVLEVSAPPYSPDFAGSMLRLMMAAGIRRQRLSTRDWAIKALLDEFAAACAQARGRAARGRQARLGPPRGRLGLAVQFKPPLTAREAAFLQDISADRPPGY
ncbi:hypothetical protein CHLNCDRAFT_133173 [Chlorella variabilis]|uniref:Uncharacterized protein n=1 Tax=Chlorella variabilis TaxID=554065 RepID=E1Z2I7_CHLVA|nr:hypothetical protein CHLNCDRAFT_133173 [Chlorella variabilis]EFN60006.1 hypothetical protein CHLNCDRAFT_133173 [Chlorella variabilis]|eukprot:XP_005852108.1 hypothetical protein CHLNCDRAFT_133173 [Chlorella variabilis]